MKDTVLDIYNKYPLTLLQRLRVMHLLKSNINNNINKEKFIKMVFDTVFMPVDDNCEVDNSFEFYIKNCLSEFYTFEYCIEKDIQYKPKFESITCCKNIMFDLSKLYPSYEIEQIIFRMDSESLIYHSNYAYKLSEQFKPNNKTKKK